METIKPVILLLVAAFSILFLGCTHNNGDIGPYFGTWKLESIEIDGVRDSGYEENIFWQFQSSVFCMRKVYGSHTQENRWGTWHEADGMLYVDFSHTEPDDDGGEAADIYNPFAETFFERGQNTLDIVVLNKKRMVAEMTASSGTHYRYTLRKWR